MPDQPTVFDEDAGHYVHSAAIANPAGGATVDAEARAAINQILAALRSRGLVAKD
ncbi:hypothetical protein AABB02_33480 [Streptomyces rimosus]|uniref:hypothetical protein n=1 Tax=Streptomyces rimosus TaxID=1927 RepID=UPI000B19D26C